MKIIDVLDALNSLSDHSRMVTFFGHIWWVTRIDDKIHLTRICPGCGDSGGARHVVEDTATVDDIVAYEMYTNELRSIPHQDLADIIAKRDADAFRIVG